MYNGGRRGGGLMGITVKTIYQSCDICLLSEELKVTCFVFLKSVKKLLMRSVNEINLQVQQNKVLNFVINVI